jgi:hypothetical protein
MGHVHYCDKISEINMVSVHGHLVLVALDLWQRSTLWWKYVVEGLLPLLIAGKQRGKGLGFYYHLQGQASKDLTSSH